MRLRNPTLHNSLVLSGNPDTSWEPDAKQQSISLGLNFLEITSEVGYERLHPSLVLFPIHLLSSCKKYCLFVICVYLCLEIFFKARLFERVYVSPTRKTVISPTVPSRSLTISHKLLIILSPPLLSLCLFVCLFVCFCFIYQ